MSEFLFNSSKDLLVPWAESDITLKQKSLSVVKNKVISDLTASKMPPESQICCFWQK